MISPYFEELSTKHSGVTFLKVDVDAVEVRGGLQHTALEHS